MTPHAETAGVSGFSIALPLALFAVLSAALAVEAGFVNIERRAPAFAAPKVVTIAPHEFQYREPTEYFRKGLAVDAPKREANVRVPLTIAEYQTSLSEYDRCVADGACPDPEGRSAISGDDTPVTGVSYDDALRYANWLSQKTGEQWRLPTDFELAYAAADRFPDDALGIDTDSKNPALRWLADYEREARRSASSDPAPQPRGSFGVSQTGLVDFGGNIWEWTSTCNRRIDLDKEAGIEEPDPANCGIMIASGRHRAPMSTFVRNPKGGGCSVGSPPDNLGFRLVRQPGFAESVKAFTRRAIADMLSGTIFKGVQRDDNEG
ncbi:formylglycine-generating enzyme required for sulfatase activity [Rhizobium sp. BK529]|uniref:SUMF1/EgtB/PvdO family nonheme iron enzyme n=1 Tax=unclassified Rhizobium TaxID=2613769 RepID=UPI00104C6519|nr:MULTISPECIES: SUMF1/EgtB/PvdO family nonheme iron enzyme [unclassified Rhizobium]MBB3593775.1 formylglycine-generating enzyme required for sulfatase activity [Rhizobium sp. BK529]TCR96006.1 formylglycine-generating enzyme required for sulfatase activity [Rhizobium sp. BK418]